MKVATPLLVCLAALLLQSCVALKPSPHDVVKYALGPLADPAESRSDTEADKVSIYVMRPNLPGYLDGSYLLFRKASGEISPLAKARWAEPLLEGIPRALGQYLDQTSVAEVSGYYPWPRSDENTAQLTLRFSRFTVSDSGEVDVAVRWALQFPDGREETGEFIHQEASWQVGDAESLVANYNQALKALAASISGSL